MLRLLVTNHTKRAEQLLQVWCNDSIEAVERYDAENLDSSRLADIVAGGTLFSRSRTIVINRLSENNELWKNIESWIDRVASDTNLIIVEDSVDKRTKAYKTLKKQVDIHEVQVLIDRSHAISWAVDQVKEAHGDITRDIVAYLVDRCFSYDDTVARNGYYNDWQVYNTIEQLLCSKNPTTDLIDRLIPSSNDEQVFSLFEAVLSNDAKRVEKIFSQLKQQINVQALYGLLATQLLQLMAATSSGSVDYIAAQLGVHPYPIKKFRSSSVSKERIIRLVENLAQADIQSKSGADPWQALWVALQ